MTRDRLQLIEQCLENDRNAYKDSSLVYKLAAKLRVCGSDSGLRRTLVTIKLAEAALLACDYYLCSEFCDYLIRNERSEGWNVCLKLAQEMKYSNCEKKMEYLIFAWSHCPRGSLNNVTHYRNLVEKEPVSHLEESNGFNRNFVKVLWEDEELSSRDQSLSNFSLRELSFVDNLSPRSLTSKSSETSTSSFIEPDNSNFTKFGCPAFYSSLFSDPHLSSLNSKYDKPTFQPSPTSNLDKSLHFLKTSFLIDELSDCVSTDSIDDALVQCAQTLICEDTPLALCYLLSLSQPEKSEQCFASFSSRLAYQIAVYYYCLYSLLNEEPRAIDYSPQKVVKLVLQGHADPQCWVYIQKYRALCVDSLQVQKIQKLDSGVNAHRFTLDSDYKKDSIIGLAMSDDAEKLTLALDLASQNEIPQWEVILCHFTYLFLNKEYNVILYRLNDNHLIDLLKVHTAEVLSRLQQDVLPTLSGYQHRGLLVYFNIVKILDEDNLYYDMTAKDHLRLLKKVKSTSAEIDYLKLIKKETPIRDVLWPAVNHETVASVSKLIKALPLNMKQEYSASELYMEWGCHIFNEEVVDSKLTVKQCVQKFNSLLLPLLGKLTVTDFNKLVRRTILDYDVSYMLSGPTRKLILDSLTDSCSTNSNQGEEWNEIVDLLKEQLDFLNKIWDDDIELTDHLETTLLNLEHCKKDLIAQERVVHKALLDPNITIPDLNCILNATDLHQPLIDLIKKKFEDLTEDIEIKLLVNRIENLMASDDIAEEACLSAVKGANLSKEIAPALKEFFNESVQKFEVTHVSKVAHLTESILAPCFEGVQITHSNVANESERVELYIQILKRAKNVHQFAALESLLEKWPAFTKEQPQLENLLLEAVLLNEDPQIFGVIEKLMQKYTYSEAELKGLVSKNEYIANPLVVASVYLLSGYPGLRSEAIQILHSLDEVEVSPEFTTIVINVNCILELVESNIFPLLIESLARSSESLATLKKVEESLLGAGLVAEAGYLRLNSKCTHPALKTCSASFDLINPFKKDKS